jgi:hypothetical protein
VTDTGVDRAQTHSVAERGVKDLDANLVLLGRVDSDLLKGEGLSGLPRDGWRLTEDQLGTCSKRDNDEPAWQVMV